jgi:ACDE family multidrug resistance protein
VEVGGGCFLGGWRLVSLTTVGQMVPGEVGSLSKNKAFWSMVTVPFLWALSNSMIIAVLPDIQTALRISPGRAGLLTTSLSIPTAILLPVAGVLSDRYGRKTIMVPGVILYGLGGALIGSFAALGPIPYWGILAGRVVQGIGAAGMTLVAMALAADLFQGEERVRVLGILEASNSLGKLVSPILGTLAVGWAWYAPFLTYPILSGVGVVSLILGIKSPPSTGRENSLRRYFQDLSQAVASETLKLVGTYSLALITIILWFGGLSATSQLLDKAKISGTYRGVLLAIPVLLVIITDLLASRYGRPEWFPYFIASGLVAMALGQMGLGHLRSPFPVILALSLGALAMGLVMPVLNSLITSAVAQGQRGAVTTTYGSVRCLGSALGPPLYGFFMDSYGIWLFLFAAVLSLGAGVAGFFLMRRLKVGV